VKFELANFPFKTYNDVVDIELKMLIGLAKQAVATRLISAPIVFNFFSGDKMGTSIINSFSASTE
jgi:hypothetical protein